MRTKGALGKPKVIAVKLKRLVEIFTSETEILVDARYAPLLAVEETNLELYKTALAAPEVKRKEESRPVVIRKIELKSK